MAERDALVLESRLGFIRLQPLTGACRDCSSGCGGRCSLFATNKAIEIELSHIDAVFASGTRVCLSIDDIALRQAAWCGYGLALIGLLAGAAVGHAAGIAFGRGENLLAMLGLVAGTFAAMFFSKRLIPAPIITATADDGPVKSATNPSEFKS